MSQEDNRMETNDELDQKIMTAEELLEISDEKFCLGHNLTYSQVESEVPSYNSVSDTLAGSSEIESIEANQENILERQFLDDLLNRAMLDGNIKALTAIGDQDMEKALKQTMVSVLEDMCLDSKTTEWKEKMKKQKEEIKEKREQKKHKQQEKLLLKQKKNQKKK